jgi:hypothetical protein
MIQNYFHDGNLSTMKKQTPSINSQPLQSWTVHQPKFAVLSAEIRQCSACTASWHSLYFYLCCNLASTNSRPLQSWTVHQPRSAVLSAEIRQCSACTASWHRLRFYLCFNFASTLLTSLSAPSSPFYQLKIRQCSACTASLHRLSLYLCFNIASANSQPPHSTEKLRRRSPTLKSSILKFIIVTT